MVSGWLADRVGRRNTLGTMACLIGIFSFLAPWLLGSGTVGNNVFIIVGFILLGLSYGQAAGTVTSNFPSRYRYTGPRCPRTWPGWWARHSLRWWPWACPRASDWWRWGSICCRVRCARWRHWASTAPSRRATERTLASQRPALPAFFVVTSPQGFSP